GVGYVGLLPRTARNGNRTQRAEPKAPELLYTFIPRHFEQPTQPPARAVYRLYVAHCSQHSIKALSERTFYRQVKARRGPEQTRARRGKRASYQEQPWYWELTCS